MNKIKYILKAAVVIGIALAFIMPGAAFFTDNQTIEIKEKIQYPIKNKLSLGRGWAEQASGFWDPSRGINFMHAVDENVAWAVGYDGSGSAIYETIFTHTSNGGELWEADIIFSDTGYGLGNICGLDANTAWAAVFSTDIQDENCGIYKTTDGGDSWTHQFEGPYSFANNVWFFDENDGVALGDQADDYFEIWTSNDGGDSWTRVPEENFSGHEVVPGEYGWTGCMEAVGDNTIVFGTHAPEGYAFISHDRGLTWFGSFTGCSGSGLNPGVNALAFKDPDNGLAAHDSGGTYDLYETNDGGVTWDEITPTGTAYASGLSYVPGTDNMYISTGADPLYSGASFSTDGGHSWTDYSEVQGIQLLDCHFVEGPIGWAGSFNVDDETGGMYKYSKDVGKADLLCEGTLYWDEIKPGATVEGEFKVKNFGDTETQLDWEITDKPSWGKWTFDPESGIDLTPEDGDVTVKVTCVVPDVKDQEFNGRVKVENLEDSNDYCDLAVTIITPKNKHAFVFQFLQSIIQQFPIIEKVISVSILLGKLLIL